MGVYLGQLPPAELARLKAELAETLIAHFCYPRFFDYRTSTLRTRPVDRAKRQEVWLYLSSIDFTAWGRVDLMSPEFQHQIERLLIHYVQRNRNFFGEQGRKRMSDIRMLISMAATSVVQGMRGHLTGQRQNNPPFGSPRPVVSWSTTNVTGRIERPWEQMLPATMLLQQQLQELRGEMLAALPVETQPPVVAAPKRNIAPPTSVPPPVSAQATNGRGKNGTNGVSQPSVPETPTYNTQHNMPPSGGNNSLSPVRQTTPASNSSSVRNFESTITPVETPIVKPPAIPQSAGPTIAKGAVPGKTPSPAQVQSPASVSAATPPLAPVAPSPVVRRTAPPSASSTAVQSRSISSTASPSVSPPAVTQQRENAPQPISEEDIAIFEQMRHQLIVWLRIEVIRAGKDIAGYGPLQLLELLRQQENVDETRLQVVSTLLNLSNQVVKNGHATILDYKQTLMFHLIHTRQ
ncbi:MAG TPA: hypothetical protein VNG51_07870 [Ktedonobacteraceae bacterium]|nr:hypothetical protein [Ktedonobacteraceae bacterium]